MSSPFRQPERARSRARRAPLAAVLLATLLTVLAVLPTAAGSTDSGAQAAIATVGDATSGAVSVSAATTRNLTTGTFSSLLGVDMATDPAVTSSTCSSYLVGRSLVSAATVTAGDVSLLGGVVTATVKLSATATVLDGDAQVTTAGSAVTVTHIAGVDDAAIPSQGDVTVPGVGTLTILHETSQAGGGEASAQLDGLELYVATATDGVPADTWIVVGPLRVRADQTTLDALLGTPTPSPTPTRTPTPTPRPSRTATPTPRPTSSATLRPSSTTVPGSSSAATSYGAMPAPATPSPAILARFPGAVFPVVGTYTYTDTFGAYRADMPNKQHEGDDIFATYGTPVVAVQDGTITGVSTTPIGGNNIHLTTSRGDYFYYAHLSRFATGLAEGQHVIAGQTIGYVGDTGDAKGTPSHLHFEIHPAGGPAVDPTPYLNAWRAAGHLVSTSQEAQQLALATPTPTPSSSADDPAIDAAVQQAADGFAALQAGITSGPRRAPGRGSPLGPVGAVLLVVNTAGALLVKRLQLGAVLLP